MVSRKNKISAAVWLLVALAAVLVAVIALVKFNTGEAPVTDYNGYPVQEVVCEGTDVTCYAVSFEIRNKPYTISFYNHPASLETVAVAPQALYSIINMQRVQNHTVIIAVPENAPGSIGVAGVALGRVLGDRYDIMNLNVKAALAPDAEHACLYATERQLVIFFEPSSVQAATLRQPNCILISGADASQATQVSEAVTYRLLGVLKSPSTNATLLPQQ